MDADLRGSSLVRCSRGSEYHQVTHAVASVDPPVDEDGTLRRLEGRENFPVALRILPSTLRRELRSVYDVARTIDDLGDEAAGDRGRWLDSFEADLLQIWQPGGEPRATVLRRLVPTVRHHDLPPEPFRNLIAANRLDQTQRTYPTWDDLRDYCRLSADPVGRIVLGLVDATTPETVELSDRICTALQVLEHCQDVGEDRRRGRTYLPLADLEDCGVALADLDAPSAGPRVRALLKLEVDRAVSLLTAGAPLVRRLTGSGRLAVAGFAAGGFATADAIRRAEYDVLGVACRPAKRDVLRHAARLWRGRP